MQERKQHVILSALKLFQVKGFTATSVQDIIEESNISKGTFYNYFSSKNEFLQAILEYIDREEFLRRERLLIGENKADKQIFIKQVLLRIEMNREFNLLPMLESIFHSEDIQLKKFVKHRYIVDLAWIQNRFLDIYGKQAAPYLNDAAIIFYSMIQQMSIIWRVLTKEKLHFPELVAFTLRRMDSLIADMMETKDHFLFEHAFEQFSKHYQITKEEIIHQLQSFLTNKAVNSDIHEMVTFLITEMKQENMRIALVESVGKHLRTVAANSEYVDEINNILLLIWQYFDVIKSK